MTDSASSYDNLLQSYHDSEEGKPSIDWTAISEDVRWWVGGQLDGDGSVGIYQTTLKVTVGKAENAWHVLEKLHCLFGGRLHRRKTETDTQQETKAWVLDGRCALDFCRVMKDYTIFKNPQFSLAARHPIPDLRIMRWMPLMATSTTTGQELFFPNAYAASKTLRYVAAHPALACARGLPNYKTSGGYKWRLLRNPVTKDAVAARVKELAAEVKRLKKVEHMETHQTLPLPYVAGLVDSDGSMSLNKSCGVELTVCQKYPAMCNALKRQLGGSVCTPSETHKKHKKHYVWHAASGARQILGDIREYLLEKKGQADLILTARKIEVLQVRSALSKLKGNQSKWRQWAKLSS